MRPFLTLFLLAIANISFAQVPADSAASLLSGRQQKEWVASAWVPVMGASTKKKCNGGESYVFHKNSSVEVKKCVNSIINTTSYQWKVVKDGRDNFLYIGDTKYQMRFKVGSDSELKLRVLAENKSALSKEVILKYEKY
jgi:hypothetical protein